ncbi:MAG: hypothetical protein QG628_1061 [Patescibacteria group bacterium]|nr:hypothetical protein [Patescibacteria group bacterium]
MNYSTRQQLKYQVKPDKFIASWRFCTEPVTVLSRRTKVRLLGVPPNSAQTHSSVRNNRTRNAYKLSQVLTIDWILSTGDFPI